MTDTALVVSFTPAIAMAGKEKTKGKDKADKAKSSDSIVERSKSMKPQVAADSLIVANAFGCCINGVFWGTLADGCCCPLCKGEWTLWCLKCQCCLDTGTEYLKCICCEPQCEGCAWFFKCSSQCCCCVQSSAIPTNDDAPCTCALLFYTCSPSERRGCCKKVGDALWLLLNGC